MNNDAAFATLRGEYSWPEQRPSVPPFHWSLDAGGRDVLVRFIRERQLTTVLEIGVFLGGSLRRWLDASPEVRVVAVDPWPHLPEIADYVRRHGHPESVAQQLAADPDGLHDTFLSNFWDCRERVIPVRATGAQVLERLSLAGLRPDLIYIDADKSGEELELCDRLFPHAILAGDDWFWTPSGDAYRGRDDEHPIRGPVRASVARRQGLLLVDKSTWVVLDSPPPIATRFWYSARYLAKSSCRRIKREFHAWRNTAPHACTVSS